MAASYEGVKLTDMTGEVAYELLVDVFSTVLIGKRYEDLMKEREEDGVKNDVINLMSNIYSNIITGKDYDKLLEEEDDLGYKYNLVSRLKKNNDILMGVLTSIYDEDKVEEVLSNIDISKLEEIEKNIGELTKNISLLKLNILENLKYTQEGELNTGSVLEEIERAIKGIVISFIAADLKSSIRMASIKGDKVDLNSDFINDLAKAYDKIASDFVKNINDDTNPSNDGDYDNLGLLK
jgi:hypothetical protein